MGEPFLGQIMPVAFDFPPLGWAFCNGQTLPINQQQALFALLGTTYGGDGVQTFQLPNLQSRVAMHAGNGHTLGESSGEESHKLTVSEIGSHTHSVSQPASKDEETTNRPDGAYFTVGGAFASPASGSAMGGTPTSATGGSQVHENRQPYLAIPFVIALQGVFPSQN